MAASASKQHVPNKKRGLLILGRVVFLLLIAAILTFAFNNRLMVPVWPLSGSHPLYWVIGASFLLGLLTGWFSHRMLKGRRIALIADAENNAPAPSQASEE